MTESPAGPGQVGVQVDESGIALLSWSNPGKLNAFTFAMYDQLLRCVETLAQTPGVRVVVLRGSGGRAFAAGTDIRQFRGVDGPGGLEYEHRTGAVFAALAALPMPLVAAVEGPAVGAGLALTLTCDLVLATPDAVFGAPVARTVGNCLSPSIVGRLYAAVGRARARSWLFGAMTVTAEDAHVAGLVSEVVPRDGFDAAVTAAAQDLASLAPMTLAALREVDRRIMAALDRVDADDVYRRTYASQDFTEGVDAFVAKRAPQWQGR